MFDPDFKWLNLCLRPLRPARKKKKERRKNEAKGNIRRKRKNEYGIFVIKDPKNLAACSWAAKREKGDLKIESVLLRSTRASSEFHRESIE